MVLLTVAGLHVPVIPLVDIPGKTGAVAPVQIGFTGLNKGIMPEVTVTFIDTGKAHCAGPGVKV